MKTQGLVPMASVANVERSIAFYGHLNFEVGNTFAAEGETKPKWAWLQSGEVIMVTHTWICIVRHRTDLSLIHWYANIPLKL